MTHQTVLEEGCHRCLWVTAQRWRARRLCCRSKARGRWASEQTVKQKIYSSSQEARSWQTHTSFHRHGQKRLCCDCFCLNLQHTQEKQITAPFPAETHKLICRRKLDPCLQKSPTVCCPMTVIPVKHRFVSGSATTVNIGFPTQPIL